MAENRIEVPTLAAMAAAGKEAEILFWVGCAGSFDERAKKITKAFVKILHNAGVSFAVLGAEETCSGDPAKRAGNEFLFQMQAATNIATLNSYGVKKVVTACPHCFNTLKNEFQIHFLKFSLFFIFVYDYPNAAIDEIVPIGSP